MNDVLAKPAGRRSRQDWIAAGVSALEEGGMQAVRVEALARRLGVSKGSFYWHFRDHAALAAALLDLWEQESTDAVIATSERDSGEDAAGRLLRVLHMVVERDGRADRAIRAWAMTDERVARRVAAVDARRLAFLCAIFSEMGFDAAVAGARARLVYTGMIGEHAVLAGLDVAERKRLATLNHAMLTGGPAPERRDSAAS